MLGREGSLGRRVERESQVGISTFKLEWAVLDGPAFPNAFTFSLRQGCPLSREKVSTPSLLPPFPPPSPRSKLPQYFLGCQGGEAGIPVKLPPQAGVLARLPLMLLLVGRPRANVVSRLAFSEGTRSPFFCDLGAFSLPLVGCTSVDGRGVFVSSSSAQLLPSLRGEGVGNGCDTRWHARR